MRILRSLDVMVFLVLMSQLASGQVITGSDGSDGVLNPTVNKVINMADHPDGVYQYSSVNIPAGVTVTFVPNAANTPVTWLVQDDVQIAGIVDISGENGGGSSSEGGRAYGGRGGPGGGAGGFGGNNDSLPTPRKGLGLGGGDAASLASPNGGEASYARAGGKSPNDAPSGLAYGNQYLLPIQGGSGGGGGWPGGCGDGGGGGGGAGAILIACDGTISLSGSINANGGQPVNCGFGNHPHGGAGSGGGIRLVASRIGGHGTLNANGAVAASPGYIRIDAGDDEFLGTFSGSASRGFNPVLTSSLPNAAISIRSVAAASVSSSPSGNLITPDVTIPAQQSDPVTVVVACANIPIGSHVTVIVKPINGPTVTATGLNNTGTLVTSTATVNLSLPRGGGIMYATATVSN